MKNVLVTGGCGFIGREVVRVLVQRGYCVRVLDDLSKPSSAAPAGAEFVRLDLTDAPATREAFRGFDSCIHLAAKIGGIGYFHKYPATILSENNKIYSSVFEAAAAERLRRIVYVSSSMVFESATQFPTPESALLKTPPPVTAYGFSKLVGEWYCRAFHDEHGLPYTIARPFNAYGVNELPSEEVGYAHVIPDLVKKLLSGQDPLEILGDGRQTRCFTHVSDLARGIVLCAEHPAAENEDFNISHPRETSIEELAMCLAKLCGRPGVRIRHVPGFEHDVRRRVPDVSKARRLLGFEAVVSLEEGLAEVVQWLRTRSNPVAPDESSRR